MQRFFLGLVTKATTFLAAFRAQSFQIFQTSAQKWQKLRFPHTVVTPCPTTVHN